MVVEYTAPMLALVALDFYFLYFAFKLEPRVKNVESAFDFVDLGKFLMFTTSLFFTLLTITFAANIISGNTTGMTDILDRMSVITQGVALLFLLGTLAYVFIVVPFLIKRGLTEKRTRSEAEENEG